MKFSKVLTFSGTLAALAIGAIILAIGGFGAILVLIIFFVTSTFLSRLPSTTRSTEGPRTVKQVLANGLAPTLGMVLLWLRPDLREPATLFFFGAIATATADTWATEIGTRFGKSPRSILTLHPVQSGVSGGVTFAGLAASLAGAALIGALSEISFPWSRICELQGSPSFLWVTIAGFAGALLDSILGATLQTRYRCTVCNSVTEYAHHCGVVSKRNAGVPLLDNSGVNLVTTMWGGIISLGFLAF
jgi:uncharacterized protein (TIGR00297 family)